MPTPNHRTAVAALDAARPLIARLDPAAHPEEAAADLIESWGAAETSLRALLGGSSLGGQALVGEARQQGLLDYPHAHALLGFLAARDRAARSDHVPTPDDVTAARSGFQALEAALGVGIAANTGTFSAVRPDRHPIGAPGGSTGGALSGAAGMAGASAPPAAPVLPPPLPPRGSAGAPSRAPALAPSAASGSGGTRAAHPDDADDGYDAGRSVRPAARRTGLLIGLLVALAAIGGLAWWALGRRGEPAAYAEGVRAYRAGQREVARSRFQQALQERPNWTLSRVYLARLAREDGDLTRATSELSAAISADTGLALAHREMGQLQLQAGRPDVAVRFLERAIRRDPADRVAQGWMGCALSRQGRGDVAERFYARAGDGDWTACRTAAPGAPGAPGVGGPGLPGAGPTGVPGVPPGVPGGAMAPAP